MRPYRLFTVLAFFIAFTSTSTQAQEEVTDTVSASPDTSQALTEIVVTALGQPRATRALGYAVQRVEGTEIIRSREGSLANALSAKVAGLQVISSAGTPGASAYLKLRGAHSVAGNSQPLIVVDGIPIDNSSSIYRGDPISDLKDVAFSSRGIDLNPADIETVDVLKGPAATALYGTRAVGGALIITTKKGRAGRLTATFNSSFAVDEVNKLPALQSGWSQGDAGRYVTGAPHAWGAPLDSLRYTADGKIVALGDAAATARRVEPFDHAGKFFVRGRTAQNTLSIAGGSERATFQGSIGNLAQTGVVPGSAFNRTTVRIGGSAGGKIVRAAGTVQYAHSGGTRFQQGSNESAVMVGLLRTPPSYDNSNGLEAPVGNPQAYQNPDGSHRRYTAAYDNPYFSIAENPFRDEVDRLTGNISIAADPAEWISILARLGHDGYSERREQIFGAGGRRFLTGRLYDDRHTYRETNADLLLTLRKTEGDFTVSLLLGQNENRRRYRNVYVQGDSLTIPGYANLANASALSAGQYAEDIRISGTFGSAKFSWKERVYLEGTGRYDVASTFGPARGGFFYPSVNAAVVLSEWFGARAAKKIDLLKVRLSYARAGKEPPLYLTATSYVSPSFGGGYISTIEFPFLGVNGFTLTNTVGNVALQPEVTSAWEGGVQAAAFGGRLRGDVALYYTRSTNQIVPYTVSSASGFSAIVGNVGSLENKGVEVLINVRPVQRARFRWEVAFNFSRVESRVLALAEGLEGVSLSSNFLTIKTRNIAGAPYGAFFGSRWLRDAEGRMIIDDDTASAFYGFPQLSPKDSIVGDPNPDWLAGISNTLSYRAFALSFLVDIRKGGDIWNGTRGVLNHFGVSEETGDRAQVKVFDGVKSSTGAANDIPVVLDQRWYRGPGSGFDGPVEQYVEDGSWVRLREVTLSYALPAAAVQKLRLSGLEVSAFGRNLVLLTKYRGIDPETNLKGADAGQGFDYFNMPGTRSVGVAVRAVF